jgi:enhancer of mRNA-decapping protein 4
MASPNSTPTRMLSTKLPKGRHLKGENVVYDIDVKLPGEMQPQLEVTPITKYASDPGLVLGRQIAVNRSYICYGLKLGAIRVLNINTALRYLLRGHTQRVSDMAFFAEDVHLLASASTDGRIFIWKINEGPDEEDKPQITGRVILAIQILGESDSVHPRVCWHPHKQEILIVAIGNRILKIDTMKAGKGETFSAEEPLKCNIDKLIDGVQLIGKHDDNITELSMCQWMKSRLASASADGTVKIWEERKATPLAVLRPHDGKPVNSVTFLTAPHRPDHIVLVTAGPLNQEVKIWVSGYEEGWLLPSDSESWICVQTLDIRSSSETNPEDAFFNQVVALPRAGLVLLANAKKNTIYAVHIEYGPNPTATRMDYISEFIVTMPILSLIGTSDSLPDGDHLVQIYCVQTQAIQQYGLNLSQCLPPPLDNVELEKTESNVSRAWDGSTDLETVNIPQVQLSTSESAVNLSSSDIHGLPEGSVSDTETKPNDVPSHNGFEHVHAAPPPLPPSPRLSRKLSGSKSSSNILATSSTSAGDHSNEPTNLDSSAEQKIESEKDSVADVPAPGDNLQESDRVVQNDVSDSPTIFKHPTHLVTPSEIFSKAALSSANSNTSQGMNVQGVAAHSDGEKFEVEVKVVGESEVGSNQENTEYDIDSHTNVTEKKEKLFYSQASDLGIQMARDTYNIEGVRQADNTNTIDAPDKNRTSIEGEVQDTSKEVPANIREPEVVATTLQSPAPSTKGKRQKGKGSQVPGASSASPSPFNSTDEVHYAGLPAPS